MRALLLTTRDSKAIIGKNRSRKPEGGTRRLRVLAFILAAWILVVGGLVDPCCHEGSSCPAMIDSDLAPYLLASLTPFLGHLPTEHPGPSSPLEHPPQPS